MDVIKIESFSFIKQQIVRHLHWESEYQNQAVSSQGVKNAVVQYFSSLLPVWNYSFQTLVVWLAVSIHVAQQQ